MLLLMQVIFVIIISYIIMKKLDFFKDAKMDSWDRIARGGGVLLLAFALFMLFKLFSWILPTILIILGIYFLIKEDKWDFDLLLGIVISIALLMFSPI